MDVTKILGNDGLALISDILSTQGRLRYLKDWDTELTAHIKEHPPTEPVVVSRLDDQAVRREYTLKVTHFPATRYRTFAYTRLRKAKPLLYAKAVTVLPPAAQLTIAFSSSPVWDELRSPGWTDLAQRYERQRYGDIDTTKAAHYLSRVRPHMRELVAREKADRIELSALIADRDDTIRPYTYDSASMRVRESTPGQRIDLDKAEADPVLSTFMTYSDRAAFDKVWFAAVNPDDAGDEFDESAHGIWTP